MIVAVHNSLEDDASKKKMLTDIVTIGDMKGLVEALAATAMAKLSASTKEKMIAAAKIVGIIVSGVAGSKNIIILDQLASQSASDVPPEQQAVAGAQLVATCSSRMSPSLLSSSSMIA